MSLSKRKTCCLVFIGLVLICLTVLSGWFSSYRAQLFAISRAAESQEQAQAGSEEKLRALLLERYDILKDIVESEKKSLEVGRGDASALKDATVAMFHADADLCSTNSERIKVYEKLVAALREYEAWAERRAAAGRATEAAVLQAKVARLDAQIKLEKLRLASKALP
jgi:flagellar hook-basal body complex protein FliE